MISFDVNNGIEIKLQQNAHDSFVVMTREDSNGLISKRTITAGQFVMMLNLYSHIMDNDIQNDFINPYGRKREE